jgi:hypothetical protein
MGERDKNKEKEREREKMRERNETREKGENEREKGRENERVPDSSVHRWLSSPPHPTIFPVWGSAEAEITNLQGIGVQRLDQLQRPVVGLEPATNQTTKKRKKKKKKRVANISKFMVNGRHSQGRGRHSEIKR